MAHKPHLAVAVVVAAAAMVALPAAASARTKLVYADAPPSAQRLLHRYSASVNDFFRHTVTIHQGDTVSFLSEGFHTIDLPGRSGADLPLIVPGAALSGVTDAAGRLFWFNGHVPSLGINPSLFQATGSTRYDGSQRVDSGLPLGSGPPKPFKVTFSKAGTYKYFCDVHPGMVGYVVVRAKGQRVPTARDDAAALAKQVKLDETAAATLARTKV